jgi:tetratricopeptide (TPR) repeat protein
MRAAYKLRAYGEFAAKDYEGALATIEEAQETYGTERDVAWAQLMKAQVLLDMGKIAEAREANMNVLNVPAWRGEPVAQATYQLGQVEEAAGEPRKAFGFYQRTYFQYKGHAGGYWAAEAYLASARCLGKLGMDKERIDTYKAMLFDPYVNGLPQADTAREMLGAAESGTIADFIAAGGSSNIAITVETEIIDQPATNAAAAAESTPAEPEPAPQPDAGETEGDS